MNVKLGEGVEDDGQRLHVKVFSTLDRLLEQDFEAIVIHLLEVSEAAHGVRYVQVMQLIGLRSQNHMPEPFQSILVVEVISVQVPHITRCNVRCQSWFAQNYR